MPSLKILLIKINLKQLQDIQLKTLEIMIKSKTRLHPFQAKHNKNTIILRLVGKNKWMCPLEILLKIVIISILFTRILRIAISLRKNVLTNISKYISRTSKKQILLQIMKFKTSSKSICLKIKARQYLKRQILSILIYSPI